MSVAAWASWQERLRAAAGHGALREALSGVAGEISAVVGRRGSLAERWSRIGVEVVTVGMRGRGRCDVSAAEPRIFVKRHDNLPAQHFTVAHEVAHLLLNSVPPEALRSISLREEEAICDEFAGELLVPQARLNRLLDGDPTPEPKTVLRMCGTFGANPSVLLAALQRRGGLGSKSYLLARWRGHYRRPAAMDFRIDAAIGQPDLFWPYGRRLRKLGFENLAEVGREAAHGSDFAGGEVEVVVPRRRIDPGGKSNVRVGSVGWKAVRQGRKEPYLLAMVDCSRLRDERRSQASEASAGESQPPPRVAVPAALVARR